MSLVGLWAVFVDVWQSGLDVRGSLVSSVLGSRLRENDG